MIKYLIQHAKDRWKSIAGVGMVIAGFATLPLTMNVWLSIILIACGGAFIIFGEWVCSST